MEFETAGDPMTGLKWTRKTTDKIAVELKKMGITVCGKTVGRILKELGYSLRVNYKNISTGSDTDRDAQFKYIGARRQHYKEANAPVISVDTKKKELVGNFKNNGKAWAKQPIQVNDHDFRSQAQGIAVPYGIYDVNANHGAVFVGTSYDTSEFAVSSIEKWWRYIGQHRYRGHKEILILADGGGSNGSRVRAWKQELQKLSDRHKIKITVCHYPPGTSKWNPIEHRLWSEISKNWAGRPLQNYQTILNYISTTKTATGLEAKAYIDNKKYRKGIKISDRQMKQLNLNKHDILPKWNYTISPR
jgi:hypothetical protein